ncbi:DUF2730 family protein [Acinetobacter soli]|uniref:DUF2730 family protein n=1 Tax=Acinetobacter soli TaxID=487316 RepID=UPI001C470B97|nr:DUF2730 family protein [Acinetobacter soli]MBV6550077.1 DUF2730 family protein [Acinetobacter soli]
MFEEIKLGLSEVQWVFTMVLTVLFWYLRRESASSKEVLDLRLRVVELENAIKDMPSKLDIAMLQGQLNTVNSKLASVDQGVKRIEDYLLANNK